MKALVKTLIVILVIIIVLVVVSFFLPSKVHIQRSIRIKAPVSSVFEQINNLKNWKNWSPWYKLDTTMKMTFTGPESGVKAKYSWDSKNKNLGKGYLEIKESVPNEYIILDMCFMENAVSTGKFLFTRDTTNVSVVWTLESDMGKNPLAKYFGLLMDKMVGSDFEKGLNEIKRITEKEYNDELKYPVNEINTDNVCALTMRIQCKQKEISEKMAQGYGELMKTMTEKKLKMSGPPFAIYHAFDKLSGVDMELGLPVNACVRLLKGDISCTNFDAFKAASVNYYGAYEGTVKAHEMIGKWVKKNNKTVI